MTIKPDFAVAHCDLGTALREQRNFTEAATEWREAIQLQPHPAFLNQLAWLLATCPEAAVRNGAEAVELAKRAVNLSGGRDPAVLDTLAAAYAEAGRFSDAAGTAQRAAGLAAEQSDTALADAIRGRIERYQARSPYRDLRPTSHAPSQWRPSDARN